jgi:hypothetical protein
MTEYLVIERNIDDPNSRWLIAGKIVPNPEAASKK